MKLDMIQFLCSTDLCIAIAFALIYAGLERQK